jgi:hypothetical protein
MVAFWAGSPQIEKRLRALLDRVVEHLPEHGHS